MELPVLGVTAVIAYPPNLAALILASTTPLVSELYGGTGEAMVSCDLGVVS